MLRDLSYGEPRRTINRMHAQTPFRRTTHCPIFNVTIIVHEIKSYQTKS